MPRVDYALAMHVSGVRGRQGGVNTATDATPSLSPPSEVCSGGKEDRGVPEQCIPWPFPVRVTLCDATRLL